MKIKKILGILLPFLVILSLCVISGLTSGLTLSQAFPEALFLTCFVFLFIGIMMLVGWLLMPD